MKIYPTICGKSINFVSNFLRSLITSKFWSSTSRHITQYDHHKTHLSDFLSVEGSTAQNLELNLLTPSIFTLKIAIEANAKQKVFGGPYRLKITLGDNPSKEITSTIRGIR
jgi:hypothetical protein